MRYFVILILWLLPSVLGAQDWEDRRVFGDENAPFGLRILSSTDTSFFAPMIDHFLQQNPTVSVEYLVSSTAEIDQIFRAAPDQFDLVISSAMDLQLKLANDGFAQTIDDLDHPVWAQWRQSLFGFTSEPAAIVINRAAFAGHPVPQTRQDLIRAMRARPEVFRGKVGTYDVRQSGLGYLFATQDARASETFWRLIEVMGSLQARLYCCSGAMIDDLADGSIVVAYNVLGSYAVAREDTQNAIDVILPSDFPTTMMRTALVPTQAPNPTNAESFLRHLIRLQAGAEADVLPLPPIPNQPGGAEDATVVLELALMTYLDALKRRIFLREWENAIIQAQ